MIKTASSARRRIASSADSDLTLGYLAILSSTHRRVEGRTCIAHKFAPAIWGWHRILSRALFTAFLASFAVDPVYAGKQTKQNTSVTELPMSLEYENYTFRPSYDESCLGEDDALRWKATGSLEPGESYTYTPRVPGCISHPAVIAVVLSWDGSELELSGTVPDNDFASRDPDQKYSQIVAPNVENKAQLCMFPFYSSEEGYPTITITNVGGDVASNVVLEGLNDNDWSIFYYPSCLNADADGDGWNDSLEHSMANMVYHSDGSADAPSVLWGSNYLRTNSTTFESDDEIDAYPPDFNDDDSVDDADVTKISQYLGQGNGIPLEAISPNLSPEFYYNNTLPWRRYDLNGDGHVSQTDVDIVTSLVGQPIPMPEDVVVPTARVLLSPDEVSVPRGEWYMIHGHVWDNAALARVEYLVDGNPVCSVTDPVPTFGYTSPFYTCWWEVPNRPGAIYDLAIRAIDAAGNVTTSAGVSMVAQ